MSIQTEIDRIVAAKEAIVAALTEKGVSVGGGKLEDLSEVIRDIPTGIDGTTGQILLTSNQADYVITHGLNKIPSAFIIFTNENYKNMSGTYRLIMAVACADSNVQYRITCTATQYTPTGNLNGVMENTTSWVSSTKRNMIGYMTEQSVTVCPSSGSMQLIANTLYTWIALGDNQERS